MHSIKMDTTPNPRREPEKAPTLETEVRSDYSKLCHW